MGSSICEADLEPQPLRLPMLSLSDVYREHGPEVGWEELKRRSICPPTPTAEVDLDAAMRNEIGYLSVTIDYVESSGTKLHF